MLYGFSWRYVRGGATTTPRKGTSARARRERAQNKIERAGDSSTEVAKTRRRSAVDCVNLAIAQKERGADAGKERPLSIARRRCEEFKLERLAVLGVERTK